MKFIITSLILLVTVSTLGAQEFDADQFKSDIVKLYEVGLKSFKTLKDGESISSENGETKYNSTIVLNGAKTVYISEDSEKNNTYVAQYTFKNVRNTEEKVQEIVNLIAEATEEFGLASGTGTDIKYVGYQKYTVEFPSDNIDDMGKYPSFVIGLTKDGNPMSFEIQITEILWK